MKKIGIMISAAAALMMAGCASDMTGTPEAGGVVTLYATVEGSDNTTRVGFDQSGSFYWSEGRSDRSNDGYEPDVFTVLSINSGVGENSASFLGEVGGQIEGYAVYPYSKDHSVSGTALRIFSPRSIITPRSKRDFFSAERDRATASMLPCGVRSMATRFSSSTLGGVFV